MRRGRSFSPGASCPVRALHHDLALVRLWGKLHHAEHALRAGKRREHEVAELRELVEGHGGLAHEHQVRGKAAHVGLAGDRHSRAEHGDDGVVDVADYDGAGHHGEGVGLRAGPRAAQVLVEAAEAREVRALVVEDLHDLLAGHHLFHIAVQRAERGLLRGEVALGAPAREARVQHHDRIARERHEGEPPVEHQQQRQGARRLHRRLHHVGEAVVERLAYGVDVVGEVAHHVAVARAVEERHRQAHDVAKQVTADVEHDVLRRVHHDLRVRERCRHGHRVDGRRRHDVCREAGDVAGGDAVYDRLDHVRAREVASACDRHQQRNGKHVEPCVAHVAHERPQRAAHVLGPRAARCLTLSHCHHPPWCFASDRVPGRWGRSQAAAHASPLRARAHRPRSRSGPRP